MPRNLIALVLLVYMGGSQPNERETEKQCARLVSRNFRSHEIDCEYELNVLDDICENLIDIYIVSK